MDHEIPLGILPVIFPVASLRIVLEARAKVQTLVQMVVRPMATARGLIPGQTLGPILTPIRGEIHGGMPALRVPRFAGPSLLLPSLNLWKVCASTRP